MSSFIRKRRLTTSSTATAQGPCTIPDRYRVPTRLITRSKEAAVHRCYEGALRHRKGIV